MTVPTGILALPLKFLRESLSQSSNFQTWTGAANATAALAFVFYQSAVSPSLPYVLLFREQTTGDMDAGGVRGHYARRGTVRATFRESVATTTLAAEDDEYVAFENSMGAILLDLLQDSFGSDLLAITGFSIEETERTRYTEEATDEAYHQLVMRFEFEDRN